jgi:6-phosphogluconolactonase
LSRPDADPAQIGLSPDGGTLVVTERATDSISSYAVGQDGSADGPTVISSSGATPYGFDFTEAGVLVVTEAAGGNLGAASASTYALTGPGSLSLISGSVGDTRSEVCWAAISPDDRHVYVTNFGDGTISSYTIVDDGRLELLQAVAGTTVEGHKGLRDEAMSRDGRYLYALHADVQQLFGWRVQQDGSLAPVGAFGDLPTRVAGLAAS